MTIKNELTTAELSERWNGQPTEQTLRAWRMKGIGPAYIKRGPKIVVYSLPVIEQFERDNQIQPNKK